MPTAFSGSFEREEALPTCKPLNNNYSNLEKKWHVIKDQFAAFADARA
jgi:hypothetical protein